MKQWCLPVTLALTAGWTLCSCDSKPGVAEARLPVAATTSLIADMVGDIGDGHVRVLTVIPLDADPHTYAPSKDDERKLREARIAFSNGLQLEGGLAGLLERFQKSGGAVLELASAINPANCKKLADGRPDPHIWGDPRVWIMCVDVVVKGLSGADPANAADYSQHGEDLKARLRGAFEWCQQRVDRIPPGARILVTGHDAFQYFADAFGFKVAAGSGAGDFIKASGVKAVFTGRGKPHSGGKPPTANGAARVAGELLSDTLGNPGEMKNLGDEMVDQGTYVGMLKGNVHMIVEALK